MIRPFGLWDIMAIKRLETCGMAVGFERALLSDPSHTSSAIAGLFTRHRVGSRTCIYEDGQDGQDKGFIQVWPGRTRFEWELGFISPALDQLFSASDIWKKLLQHLNVLGAQEGIQRIWASFPEDSSIETTLRQTGYTVMGRGQVFQLTTPPQAIERPSGFRIAVAEDRGALWTLCHDTIPLYRVAEDERLSSTQPGIQQHILSSDEEFIYHSQGQIIAWITVCHGRRGEWVSIIVRPENRGDVLPAVQYALTLCRPSVLTPVYCEIPDYAIEMGWLLRTLAFEPLTRKVRLATHTTASLRIRRTVLAAGLEGADVGPSVCRSRTISHHMFSPRRPS